MSRLLANLADVLRDAVDVLQEDVARAASRTGERGLSQDEFLARRAELADRKGYLAAGQAALQALQSQGV